MHHEYKTLLREWFLPLARTLVVVVGLGLLIRILSATGLLPAPPVGWDPELGVMERQSLAPREVEGAEIVLAGDSTCLVGTDASQLSGELEGQPQVRSLALYIWLSLDVYAGLAGEYARAHPGQTRVVVLLVCTPKVTDENYDKEGEKLWRLVHDRNGRNNERPELMNTDWLGSRILRRNLLSHGLATPLRGNAADYFGFSPGIQAYMQSHHGSLPGFGTAPPLHRIGLGGSPLPPYTLCRTIERQSREFRKKLPPDTRLFIGFTPGMAETSPPNELLRRQALLREWNAWVGADALLTNLPPTLPDIFFSPGAHLNRDGQRVFTKLLARELAPLLVK